MKTPERVITLVSNIDDHYAMPLTVTLRSAAENLAKDYRLQAFILEENMQEESKTLMRNSLVGLDVELIWCPSFLPDRTFTLGSHPGGVAATYFKLFLGDVLPPEIERAIYLDADTVVCQDLLELWETDLEGCALAAVADSTWQWERLRDLKLPEAHFYTPDSYFNCGVMLIDLQKWRNLDVPNRTASFAQRYRKDLWLVDQDLINCVLDGRYKRLHPRWNLLDFYGSAYHAYWRYLLPHGYTAEMLVEANANPAIVHYSGIEKPWTRFGATHDMAWFTHYYVRTCWVVRRDMPLENHFQQELIAMLKTFYREMERGRVHGVIAKDIVRYMLRHPAALPVLVRLVSCNLYWAARAYLAPRMRPLKATYGIRP